MIELEIYEKSDINQLAQEFSNIKDLNQFL